MNVTSEVSERLGGSQMTPGDPQVTSGDTVSDADRLAHESHVLDMTVWMMILCIFTFFFIIIVAVICMQWMERRRERRRKMRALSWTLTPSFTTRRPGGSGAGIGERNQTSVEGTPTGVVEGAHTGVGGRDGGVDMGGRVVTGVGGDAGETTTPTLSACY
ncbi:hypothetical protein OTU49_007472, partial [Cherax quadricarinatus]